jgi:hypothetical protein
MIFVQRPPRRRDAAEVESNGHGLLLDLGGNR